MHAFRVIMMIIRFDVPRRAPLVTEIVLVCQKPLVKDKTSLEEEDLYTVEPDEAGYQSTFARLHSVSKAQNDPTAEITDLNQFVRERLMSVATTNPAVRCCCFGMIFLMVSYMQVLSALKMSLPVEAKQYLGTIGIAL